MKIPKSLYLLITPRLLTVAVESSPAVEREKRQISRHLGMASYGPRCDLVKDFCRNIYIYIYIYIFDINALVQHLNYLLFD